MPQEVTDQQFVEYMVKAIVDHPEHVFTERSIDEMGILISLHVGPEDMGTIIGKEGRTAKALRTLLRVYGAKNDARVNLKIIEPEGSRPVYLDDAAAAPLNTSLQDALRDVPQDELA